MFYWLKIIVLALVSTYAIFVVVELSVAKYYRWLAKKYSWMLEQELHWQRLILSYMMYQRMFCHKADVTKDDLIRIPKSLWKVLTVWRPEQFIKNRETAKKLLDYANSEDSKLTEKLLYMFRDIYTEEYETWCQIDEYIVISNILKEQVKE